MQCATYLNSSAFGWEISRFFASRAFMGKSSEGLKGALYRIWCGVNRLGDSGVKVV